MHPGFQNHMEYTSSHLSPGVSGQSSVTNASGEESNASPDRNQAFALPPAKRRRTVAIPLTDCCRTCRLRKVKCTGNPGSGPCSNCSRLELACSFVTAHGTITTSGKVSRSAPSQSHTEAGTVRKRAQRACALCHSHKTKCSGDLPKCKRCEAGGFACEYIQARRKFSNLPQQIPEDHEETTTAIQTTPSTADSVISYTNSPSVGTFPLLPDVTILTAEELLIRKNLILRHFDAFCEHLYSCPTLGFLHPQTTYTQIQEGTINPIRAAAICASASFFVNPGEAARDFGTKCSDLVEFHLFRHIMNMAEETMVLYALNMVFNFLNGSFNKVWICFGIATRLMLALQANWDSQLKGRSFIEDECLRRIAWHTWNMDRLLAGGYDEYVSCRKEIMKVRLPCNDAAFRENREVVAERLQDRPGKSKNAIGIYGWQLRLVDVRHRVQVMTRKLMPGSGANRAQLEPSRVMAEISSYQNELIRIHAALPEEVRLSDQSIARYMPSKERAGFVFLHTHLAICHIDLYRFALPNMHEQTSIEVLKQLPHDFIVKCQKQTVAHALCLARFCQAIQDELEKQPKDGTLKLAGDCTIGHMSTQCLRVLLIALQHKLYENLEGHSTAPLWRYERVDEPKIRTLITEGLFRVTEPWGEVLGIAKQAHESNKTMLEDFDRTRQFADQRGTAGFSGPKPVSGGAKLPGPHYILERIHVNMGQDEQRKEIQDDDTNAVDRWFRKPESISSKATSDLLPIETPQDGDCAPPGMPLLLAQARSAADTKPNEPGPSLYAADTDWMGLYWKPDPWTVEELSSVMNHQHQMMPNPSMHLMPMEGTPNHAASAYSQTPTTQGQMQPFITQQTGHVYVEGYHNQYNNVSTGSSSYMPPNNYG